ncbi:DUF1499 domain-containing protein [Pontibaca salina]|uniref:DUF1499 domain-containing protein n=1 Tax=Pontibaca salina TaxID=2795731 RepID=A0A934M3F4_9RHOB|nr:DUF1499 domain-containing protein [Pontibaca salina]MBI6629789.1 DUF1499 domain-containing protein [Pontibaca salina]
MRYAIVVFWVVLALIAAGITYVRLAPSELGRWHRMPEFQSDSDFENGVNRILKTGPDGLAGLAAVAKAGPRTRLLAGSPAHGMMTWITRTKWIGFPDYTTAVQEGDMLRIHARSRFGKSDLRVNRVRVDGWISQLKPQQNGAGSS